MSRTGQGTAFEDAHPLADTVLFEGYMLYPYRANDPKNRVRWQFGVLAPPAFVDVDPSERTFLQSECLLEGDDVLLEVQVRFLHVQQRTVEVNRGGAFEPVDSLDVGRATYLPWDEAVVYETTIPIELATGADDSGEGRLHVPSGAEVEMLVDSDGRVAGRFVRERRSLDARLVLTVTALPGPYGVRRVRLRLDNCTAWEPTGDGCPDRPEALRHSLVAAHLLVAARGGAFVSLIDPPEWASRYAEDCEQIGTFPVLAGAPGARDLVLASPIILYDHPQVAPESASQFCDATEMDEMLTLRTLTLTDEEKRHVRGSDAKAAALVDQVDTMPPELIERLHGAIRSMTALARPAAVTPDPLSDDAPPWWNPAEDAAVDPETDFIVIDDTVVARGTQVVLRPGARRTDAQDMFLAGRHAHVQAVIADVDGGRHLAVTLDDLVELADAGYNPHGRFLYFAPDEVEPIGVGG
jgi:hypothetical protein